MLYREAGQFKTTSASDQAIFPIPQDRVGLLIVLILGFVVIPLVANEYWLGTIMIPFLVFSIAAIGLNILTGYAGQLSLGTGGFMACGAFAAYKLSTAFPELNIVVVFLLSGVITALVGVLFGLPSLRIKGFYLAASARITTKARRKRYLASGVASEPVTKTSPKTARGGAEITPEAL